LQVQPENGIPTERTPSCLPRVQTCRPLRIKDNPPFGCCAEMKLRRLQDFIADLARGSYAVGIVKLENPIPPASEPAGLRPRLTELREALLLLHKALLESERISYEATFGKIASPYQFLKLLTDDPWFAWLSPMTKLIAAMDERLDAKEPLTVNAVDALVAQTRTMLVATEGGEGFSRHYDEALQRTPDVVFAQAAVAKLIRTKTVS
jgi:hypothetical protein